MCLSCHLRVNQQRGCDNAAEGGEKTKMTEGGWGKTSQTEQRFYVTLAMSE